MPRKALSANDPPLMPSYTNENEKKDKINKIKRIEAFPSHIPPFMVSFISVITALNAHLSVSYRSINATRLVDDFPFHGQSAATSRKPQMFAP